MTRVEERWVPIEGFSNYEISNYGEVTNVNTGLRLKPMIDRRGYMRLNLYRGGVRENFLLHRLVAMAFFLNYQNGIAVYFINGDKRDCSVLNLTLSGKKCRPRS